MTRSARVQDTLDLLRAQLECTDGNLQWYRMPVSALLLPALLRGSGWIEDRGVWEGADGVHLRYHGAGWIVLGPKDAMTEAGGVYGYWVSPEGEKRAVYNAMGHMEEAKKIVAELKIKVRPNEAYYALMQRGWVRVAINPQHLSLGLFVLNPLSATVITDMVEKTLGKGGNVYVWDGKEETILSGGHSMRQWDRIADRLEVGIGA